MSFVININSEEAAVKPSVIFGSEKAPVGTYKVKLSYLAVSRTGGPDEVTGEDRPYVYNLKCLLSHADKAAGARYKSLNYNLDILGSKQITTKKGEVMTIDFKSNLARFLRDIGFDSAAITGDITLTASEEAFKALSSEDSWKGTATDILVNGQSVLEYAKGVVLNAAVKPGKKEGTTFVAGVFI